MGIDRFQENFREWLVRTFEDRRFILGQSDVTRECHGASLSAADPVSRNRNKWRKICELHAPPALPIQNWNRELEQATMVLPYSESIRFWYQNDKSPYTTYLHYQKTQEAAPTRAARLYLNFDHTNVVHSGNLIRFLLWKMAREPENLPHFKAAAPGMNPDRRDSIVIFLSEAGIRTIEGLASELSAQCPMRPQTVYGTLELMPGIGFCFEPARFPPGDWRRVYTSNQMTFGSLMAAYILRGLKRAPGSPDGLADQTAGQMLPDGIDPMALYKLSESTRVPITDPAIREKWQI